MTFLAARRLLSGLVAAGLIGALTGCEPIDLGTGNGAADPAAPAAAGPVPAGTLDGPTAANRLAELADAPPGSLAGYERDCHDGQPCVFGQPWLDVDGDGCDQRSQVLARDLAGAERKPGRCGVVSGTLTDPYTGKTVNSVSRIQIDHVVPLAEMWRSGAATWSPDRRTRAANDLGNLIAVEGKVNQAKGDKTPDEWMPPSGTFHCAYARVYVTVKLTYQLTVTPAERAALAEALGTC